MLSRYDVARGRGRRATAIALLTGVVLACLAWVVLDSSTDRNQRAPDPSSVSACEAVDELLTAESKQTTPVPGRTLSGTLTEISRYAHGSLADTISALGTETHQTGPQFVDDPVSVPLLVDEDRIKRYHEAFAAVINECRDVGVDLTRHAPEGNWQGREFMRRE